MEILAALIRLLGFLFMLVAMVGLVAPGVFKDKKTGEVPKRFQLAVVGGVASVIAFAIASALLPEPEPQKAEVPAITAPTETPANATPAKVLDTKPETGLGMTPEEFRLEFNRTVAEVSNEYKQAKFDIQKGEALDTFTRTMTGNASLVGSVNKRGGAIKELLVIVGGGGQEADTLKSMFVLLAVSHAANPTVTKEQNSKAVMTMVKQVLATIEDGESVERTVGELRYTASASKLTGLMFAISPNPALSKPD